MKSIIPVVNVTNSIVPMRMQSALLNIPSDPKKKLTASTRAELARQLDKLIAARKELSIEQVNQNKEVILENYYNNCGISTILATIAELKGKLQVQLNKVAQLGYDIDSTNSVFVSPNSYQHNCNITVSSNPIQKDKIQKLVKLAEIESDKFSEYDMLQIRLSMAETYEEAATILNAAAGQDLMTFKQEK